MPLLPRSPGDRSPRLLLQPAAQVKNNDEARETRADQPGESFREDLRSVHDSNGNLIDTDDQEKDADYIPDYSDASEARDSPGAEDSDAGDLPGEGVDVALGEDAVTVGARPAQVAARERLLASVPRRKPYNVPVQARIQVKKNFIFCLFMF